MRSRGSAHQRNWNLMIRVQPRPAFLPLFLPSCFAFLSELAFSTSNFLLVLLLPVLWFVASRETKGKFVGREMDSLSCTTRNDCLLGIPAHSNDLPGREPFLHLTGPPSPFSCRCAWAFQRSVIKNTKNLKKKKSFLLTLLWVNSLCHLLWTGKRESRSKLNPAYYYHFQ